MNPIETKSSFLTRSHKPLMFLVALLILGSAPWARHVLNWLKAALAPSGLKILVGIFFLAAGAAFVLLVRLWTLPRRNLLAVLVLLLAGFGYSLTLTITEERIHLVEYAALGLLACPSLKRNRAELWGWIWLPVLFVVGIGIVDEIFQWLLPNRVGDVRDVLFNALGGLWGIGLYITTSWNLKVKSPNYS